MKYNDGFTLVELLCAIVAGSIVTAATATILLLGLRMNANANQMATQDNQAVVCLTVMENMIKSREVAGVEDNKINEKVDESNTVPLFTYSSEQIVASSGAVLLEGVKDCKFSMEEGLLTIKFTLDETPLDETPFLKTVLLRTGQNIDIG